MSNASTDSLQHTGLRIDHSFEHPQWKLWEFVLPCGVKLSELKNHFFFTMDNIALNFTSTTPTGEPIPGSSIEVKYDLTVETVPVSLTMTGVDVEEMLNQHLAEFIQILLTQEQKDMSTTTFSGGPTAHA